VLVVEDEGLIRTNAVEMIEMAGFEAISASDADEAIRILESRYTSGVHRRANARLNGWTQAGAGGEKPLASCSSHRDIRPDEDP
jgi:hypothetical protein